MRKYIVKVDDTVTTCNLLTFLCATFYRKLRKWSKPRVIGSFSNLKNVS